MKFSRGFTMIELIFVIVILGILAAVAIPKIAVTRNDAKATASLANWKIAVNQIQATATAKGRVPDLDTFVEASDTLIVTPTTITAQVVTAGNTNVCAVATVTQDENATLTISDVDGTLVGCSLFADVEEGVTKLLGESVAR
ncbi:prepilin-type N-terminal cleavage/methylation domain-containing protein [Sulfurimonas sp.]|uniref:type II secretion system protein n=1 Tax=Sulfurimonas sp. TaxID=2022749 RepID=UPI0025DB1124|nr:prepilin-type N-terminal cleavage/methylation domain-containing protein [Sulfurimonas sp.]